MRASRSGMQFDSMWSRYGSVLICCGKVGSSPWRPQRCYRDFIVNMAQKRILKRAMAAGKTSRSWFQSFWFNHTIFHCRCGLNSCKWVVFIQLISWRGSVDEAESSWKATKWTMLFAVSICWPSLLCWDFEGRQVLKMLSKRICWDRFCSLWEVCFLIVLSFLYFCPIRWDHWVEISGT